jgi:ribosomal protein L4
LVVDGITATAPKTKTIANLLNALAVSNSRNLLIIDPANKNVYLSGRNIKNLHVRPVSEINALDILHSENIIFGAQDLVRKVEEAVKS